MKIVPVFFFQLFFICGGVFMHDFNCKCVVPLSFNCLDHDIMIGSH